MKFFGKISKVDEQEDGSVIVEGIASSECVDRQGEVVKADAMKAAIPDYLSTGKGPLREMHQPIAAGFVFKADVNENGDTVICAKVVDPTAVLKVKEGVYQGFSIGGKAMGKVDGVISSLKLTEISLVDRPANPEAMISMWKGDEIEQTEEVEKKDEPVVEATEAKVEKGMSEVRFAADILQQLEYLRESCMWEAECENDKSPIPAKLKEVVATLGNILTEMTKEEVEEIKARSEPVVEAVKADALDDVAKAESVRIQKAHDDLVALGATCSHAEKSDNSEDLAKLDAEKSEAIAKVESLESDLAKMASEKDEAIAKVASLESDIAKLADEKKALEETVAKKDEQLTVRDAEVVAKDARIAQLEAMPAAPKGVLRTVEKVEDGIGVKNHEGISKVNMQNPLDIMKAVHAGIIK